MRKHAIFRPSPSDVVAAADAFRLLGEPTRLHIVWRLRQGPAAVGELAAEAEANLPAMSQHLAKLRMAGLVRASRRGQRMIYELADDHVGELVAQALAHLDHEPEATGRPRAVRP
jgi:DNA-binding transcriptional ArsR family regulator